MENTKLNDLKNKLKSENLERKNLMIENSDSNDDLYYQLLAEFNVIFDVITQLEEL